MSNEMIQTLQRLSTFYPAAVARSLATSFALLSALAFTACSSSDVMQNAGSMLGNLAPTVEGVAPRITGLDFQGVNLAFDVTMKNPYPVAIRTPRFRYGLEVAGASFGSGDTTVSVDLPAQQNGVVTLPVRVGYLDLWNLVQNLRGAKEAPYKLSGALLVRAMDRDFELPVSTSGMLPILQVPEFRSVNVAPTEVTMTRAAVRIDAEIVNPNILGIGVSDLGYDVRIGSVTLGSITAATGKPEIAAGESESLALTGEISVASAVISLLTGGKLGTPTIVPKGVLRTPYGEVRMDNVLPGGR